MKRIVDACGPDRSGEAYPERNNRTIPVFAVSEIAEIC
jgi:hypothetical protein